MKTTEALAERVEKVLGNPLLDYHKLMERYGEKAISDVLDKTEKKRPTAPEKYFRAVLRPTTPEKAKPSRALPPFNKPAMKRGVALIQAMLSDDEERVESALQEARAMAGGREG
jgi:hypothetical protein